MRAIRLLAWLALVPIVSACQTLDGVGRSSESRGLSRVLSTGELRVGMTGDQLPMNYRTAAGDWLGFEVAVMNVLAHNLGVRASFVQRPFAELLDSLEAGDVDIVMSGVTITPRRNRRAAFVGPYFVSGKSVLADAAKLSTLKATEDLDRPGLRIVALEGSTSEAFVRRVAPRSTLTTVGNLSAAIDLVAKKQVDAVVADYETCALALLRYPEANLEHLQYGLTVEPMGIAVPPSDMLLANLLENYMQALVLNGGIQRIQDRWFNDPTWLRRILQAEAEADGEAR